MTIEEAIKELKLEWDIFVEGTGLKGYEKEEAERNTDFKQIYEADMMAIAGLEAWEKVKAEIMDINVIRDEYSQRQNDYCDGIEFAKRYILQIIDKYKTSPTGEEV